MALVVGSIWYLWPTVQWYGMPEADHDRLEREKDPILGKILNLGLDLRGGMHLLYRLDVEKLPPNTKLGDALDRAIEVIRNRVDQFGVAEPIIARQGDRSIVVQLPGVKDPQRAIDIIGKTALLEFRMVNDQPNVLSRLREKATELKLSILDEQGQVPAALLSLVPTGYTVLAGRDERQFIVTSSAALTGAYLTNAMVKVGGEYGRPYVAIDFNKDGARMFADLTERHVGKNLAIVLDGVVQSAPVIRTRIPDGHAIIEGSFTPDDAKNLSIVLRAGSLPVPLLMEENRTVGPTLGQDSIRSGRVATGVGVLLVILFMAFYYRVSGMIAGFGLIQNIVYLMGALAALHATLTLPGIAGIILTMGMSVDANVLIFERVREELRQGKTTRLAIDAGYDKAFSSILDSHVTTLITALVLFQFGTGPVKGFAVTLSLGVAISLFSALVGTKVVYDWMGRNFALQTLSI